MKPELSKWFEKKYLEWQLENGKASISEFAKFLGLSQGYASQLMNGTRTGMSMKAAQKVCEKLNDWSLYDLLGYKKDNETNLDYLPESFRNRLEAASAEVERVLSERGLTGESPEAESIVIEIFEHFGFKYTDTEI